MKAQILLLTAALSLSSTMAFAQQSNQTMPGGRGDMADHPHAQRGPGSARPMQPQRNEMPAGQGDMSDHPHASQGGRSAPMASRTDGWGDRSARRGEMPNYPLN